MATLKKQDENHPEQPVISHRNRYFQVYRNKHEQQKPIPPVANRSHKP